MNEEALDYLACPECQSCPLRVEAFERRGLTIENGRLICDACGGWYRIEEGVSDLLPVSLRRENLYEAFAGKHGLNERARTGSAFVHGKTTQIEFFGENLEDYEANVVNSSYYQALDDLTVIDWIDRRLSSGQVALDVGCGTGRQSIPMAERGLRVIAVDIAEDMLRLARQKAREKGVDHLIDFITGDGESLPAPNGAFDAAVIYGVLHHVPNKAKVLLGIGEKLKPSGCFYSLDPHDSPVRPLFDLLMRVWKLYEEEASDEAMISERQMTEWLQAADITCSTRLSTYLPPHVFYLMSSETCRAALGMTDLIFNRLPMIRRFGGVITCEGKKTGGNSEATIAAF